MWKAIKRFLLNLWRSIFGGKKKPLPIGKSEDVEIEVTDPDKYKFDLTTAPQIPLKLNIVSLDPDTWFKTDVSYLITSKFGTFTVTDVRTVQEAVEKYKQKHEAEVVNNKVRVP